MTGNTPWARLLPPTDGGVDTWARRSASASGRITAGSQSRRAGGVVEGDEDLAAVAVEDGEPLAGARPRRRSRRRARRAWRPPRPGSPRLTVRPLAVAIPTRRPVNEPGPSPTATRSTAAQPPAASAQRSTSASSPVAWRGRPALVQAQLGLGEDLAVAPGAGGGVGGRGVEADDDQEARPRPAYFTRKTEVPTFLPLTNQVTWWRPTLVEVILLT